MGFSMCLGSNSRIKYLVVLLSLVLSLTMLSIDAYSNPLLSSIMQLVRAVAVRRAATVAATKAAAKQMANSTVASVSNVARSSTVKSLKLSDNTLPWAGVAVVTAALMAKQAQNIIEGDASLHFATFGELIGNGKYKAKFPSGVEKIVNFEPTNDNPAVFTTAQLRSSVEDNMPLLDEDVSDVIASHKAWELGQYDLTTSTNPADISNGIAYGMIAERKEYFKPLKDGVSKGYTLPRTARFYFHHYRDKYYFYGSNAEDIAMSVAYYDNPDQDTFSNFKGTDSFGNAIKYLRHKLENKFSYLDSDIKYYLHEINTVDVILKHLSIHSDLSSSFEPISYVPQEDGNKKSRFNIPSASDYEVRDFEVATSYLINVNHEYVSEHSVLKNLGTMDNVLEDDEFLSKEIDIELLTRLVNQLIAAAAAQRGYSGVPFSPTDLVTREEIEDIMKQNGLYITNAHLFDEVDVYTVPKAKAISQPKSVSATRAIPKAGAIPKVSSLPRTQSIADADVGFVPSPDLDNPPTGAQILEPIKNLLPFMRDLNLSVSSAECPVAEFDVFDKHVVMDSHCVLLERVRLLFGLVAHLIWAFLALRIVLSA